MDYAHPQFEPQDPPGTLSTKADLIDDLNNILSDSIDPLFLAMIAQCRSSSLLLSLVESNSRHPAISWAVRQEVFHHSTLPRILPGANPRGLLLPRPPPPHITRSGPDPSPVQTTFQLPCHQLIITLYLQTFVRDQPHHPQHPTHFPLQTDSKEARFFSTQLIPSPRLTSHTSLIQYI